jgi:serine/arginine repetitive matrix protein 2
VLLQLSKGLMAVMQKMIPVCRLYVTSWFDLTDELLLAMLRLGIVESILTPARVSPPHRPNSYTGETSGVTRPQDQPTSSCTLDVSGERILSGLHPPASDATRSSYMTTSTASRMSGLSDFPAPPKDPHHMSLGGYFNESLSEASPPPPDQQVFFGRNQDAGDLVKTLSSSS